MEQAISADGQDHPPQVDPLEEAVRVARVGQYVKALELFERFPCESQPEMAEWKRLRALSYYGLCQAMVWGKTRQALSWCKAAVGESSATADLYFNLGMVHLRARQRELAKRAFNEGLRLEPNHMEILGTMDKLKLRRRPFLGFLNRKHPLNKYLGMLRSRLFG
jgi:tetratricopeptide (TPR) repeat protein